MAAPHRLIIRLALAIIAVAAFATAYLIVLALEAPNVRAAAAPDNSTPDRSAHRLSTQAP